MGWNELKVKGDEITYQGYCDYCEEETYKVSIHKSNGYPTNSCNHSDLRKCIIALRKLIKGSNQ